MHELFPSSPAQTPPPVSQLAFVFIFPHRSKISDFTLSLSCGRAFLSAGRTGGLEVFVPQLLSPIQRPFLLHLSPPLHPPTGPHFCIAIAWLVAPASTSANPNINKSRVDFFIGVLLAIVTINQDNNASSTKVTILYATKQRCADFIILNFKFSQYCQ